MSWLLALILAILPPGGHVESSATIIFGQASTYGAGWSPRLIALPRGPGWAFRVCPLGHAGRCLELVSTDAGPNRRLFPRRIVDLPVWAFDLVCGVKDWRIGLCDVSVAIEGRVR
jgi:hypothetical protein